MARKKSSKPIGTIIELCERYYPPCSPTRDEENMDPQDGAVVVQSSFRVHSERLGIAAVARRSAPNRE